MISIIVPTYNEKENIKKLIPAIHRTLSGHEHELLVVDDNSPDGTAEIAEEMSREYPIKVLRRSGKLGLASAVIHGFKHAKGDVLGVMDADLQHPPEYVVDFALAVMNGHDIAVGSRYTQGGKIEGWSKYRLLISRGAVMLSKPLTNVSDPMSGYFFLKRRVIENISFSPIGYKILLEILARGSYENVKEIPYTFKIRKNGKSKLGGWEYFNYLKLLYYLYGYKLKKILNSKVKLNTEKEGTLPKVVRKPWLKWPANVTNNEKQANMQLATKLCFSREKEINVKRRKNKRDYGISILLHYYSKKGI